jgi:hypothetical protein
MSVISKNEDEWNDINSVVVYLEISDNSRQFNFFSSFSTVLLLESA